ncbi:CAP domain-containing protein [uncultured Lutibacter sp.]|uniref:CAP domain-containing protein n=1 Tax=uncultured Lutibacter sp. TaxID=437739 RepID=UPI00261DD032|nr:CAP domain-containing protein [uncultured Lutibacter sp.]
MNPSKINLLLFAFVCTVITSCSIEENGIYFDEINEVKEGYSIMELEIMDLVNNHREELGLFPLINLNIISSVALSHTTYMVETNVVNHNNFAENHKNLVIKANAKSVGENVAYGFETASGVVNGWLNSEGHKAILEKSNYTHFGISIEQNSEGRNYFTQIFIQQ